MTTSFMMIFKLTAVGVLFDSKAVQRVVTLKLDNEVGSSLHYCRLTDLSTGIAGTHCTFFVY